MKRGWILILFVLIVGLQFISAAHTVSPTSFPVGIYSLYNYTIEITNTDVEDADPVTNANITRVDITLPSGLAFISGKEGTGGADSEATFSIASNVLTWTTNADWLISSNDATDNDTRSFWFTANATTLGTFNMTIKTTNSTSTSERGVTITISDTSSPSVTLNSPANNNDDTDGVLVFDCSATDNYDLDSIALYIWDNSSSEIHKNILNTAGLSNQTNFDYTFSSDGTYKWNCFANDSTNNFVWASNRTIKISASLSSCTPDWNCDESDWGTCIDDLQTRICNDLNSCGNNATKPAENQSCACVPEWDCTDWAPVECPKSEKQTKTCIDTNDCGSASGKPTEERVCTPESSGPGIALIAGIIAVILLGSGIAAFFYFKNKSSGENIPQTPQTYGSNYNNYGNTQGNNQGYTYKYS